MRVAFAGLGIMGYPMAGYLSKAGHDTVVYNRTPSKAEQWVAEYGGSSAATPQAAATDAEIVFCCVGNDDDVREVILGGDPEYYKLVAVPAMVWAGFQCISEEPAIMANCASILHRPDEAENLSLDDPAITYQW